MPVRNITFTPDGWGDYTYWVERDQKTLAKINTLLKELSREDPFTGTGKPEQLKHALTGTWSRRISREHRLIYLVTDTTIVVLQARYHYS